MRSPRFLINPRLYLPCSPTPAGLFLQTILRSNSAPATATTEAPALGIFGAQSHGFYSRCLRFTIRSPYTCKTRFRLVVNLYRVRLDTHRAEAENFKCFKEHYSNSSGLAWRDTTPIVEVHSGICTICSVSWAVLVGCETASIASKSLKREAWRS